VTRAFCILPYIFAVVFAIVVALLGGCKGEDDYHPNRYEIAQTFRRDCYNRGRVPIRFAKHEWLCVLPEQAHGR
jgi:hypothetical protein